MRYVFNKTNKVILAELVRSDFKLRYESSILGYIWSILNPLLLFAVLYVVFALFLGVGRGIEHFPVYLLLGIVMWRFFTETTNNGLKSIVSRRALMRKIYFPRYIVVISGTVSALINLGINLLVVLVFMVINGVPFSFSWFLLIPIITLLYLFALGITFFLSAINVFMRDVAYLWEIFIQAAFYATPIIYPLSMVQERLEWAPKVLMANPIAFLIQEARYVAVSKDSITAAQVFNNPYVVFIYIIAIILIVILGIIFFRSKSAKFAEVA